MTRDPATAILRTGMGASDPLDMGCEHSRCPHTICRECEAPCPDCCGDDDDDYTARDDRAWKMQQRES